MGVVVTLTVGRGGGGGGGGGGEVACCGFVLKILPCAEPVRGKE